MAKIELSIKGLEEAIASYRATPKQVERATINAINAQGTTAKGGLTRKVSRGTSLNTGIVRNRVEVKRIDKKRNRIFAKVTFRGQRIPIFEWRYEIVQPTRENPHPTRAYVRVWNTLGNEPDVVYAFANPLQRSAQGGRVSTMARYDSKPKVLEISHGVSLRRPFAEAVDASFLAITQSELEQEFLRKLEKQLG